MHQRFLPNYGPYFFTYTYKYVEVSNRGAYYFYYHIYTASLVEHKLFYIDAIVSLMNMQIMESIFEWLQLLHIQYPCFIYQKWSHRTKMFVLNLNFEIIMHTCTDILWRFLLFKGRNCILWRRPMSGKALLKWITSMISHFWD